MSRHPRPLDQEQNRRPLGTSTRHVVPDRMPPCGAQEISRPCGGVEEADFRIRQTSRHSQFRLQEQMDRTDHEADQRARRSVDAIELPVLGRHPRT